MLSEFRQYLIESEKSEATVNKYERDVSAFLNFCRGDINKGNVVAYKMNLRQNYAASSANSMIAAVNAYLKFIHRPELCVRQLKTQKKLFTPSERELNKAEYLRLVRTAEKRKNKRLSLVLQTVCGTGIRISELEFITVEAVRAGEATVDLKGKSRRVFIVAALRRKLLSYANEQNITAGRIFVTATGRKLDRSNIWREMKSLCNEAGVSEKKVFPHNLRHLFARLFYKIEKDVAKLADILGHSSIDTTRIYIMSTGYEHKRRMENMRLII